MTEPEYEVDVGKVRVEGLDEVEGSKVEMGKMELYKDRIELTIKGTGFMNFSKESRTIPYEQIQSISIGGNISKKIVLNTLYSTYHIGMNAPLHTEHVIRWKNRIEEMREKKMKSQQNGDGSIADEIRELHGLKEDGIISDREFQKKKEELL